MKEHHRFARTRLLALPLLAALLLPICCRGAAAAPPRKKLIATGWDRPDTARLRENLAQMEQQPFDGVVFEAIGRDAEQRPVYLRATFSDRKWERDWFRPGIDDLKACRFQRFTDIFLSVGANPGNVDWFDDAGWGNLVDHWRIAASLAREMGVKGILFDPEPYTKPFRQFAYNAQPGRDQHSFEEYYAKARERGREVMRAVAAEAPETTILCYFLNMANRSAVGHPNPRAALAMSGYGLLAAFLEGWLDVIPPTLTLVDGCEDAYRFNDVEQFLEAAVFIRGEAQALIAPENRAKYRAQVQAGFGIYLDAYLNPETSPWYIDGKGGPRVNRLRENVTTALRVADEYVWVYGEKYRWWPTPNASVQAQGWDEALPGCRDALRFAGDPVGFARDYLERLRREGKRVELARNGDFQASEASANEGPAADWEKQGAPAGWSTWQESSSEGSFAWDRGTGATGKGAARAAGMVNGCFIQQIAAQPGERYAVRALRRIQGRGEAWIRVRWQTPAGKWIAEERDVTIGTDAPAAEWGELFGVAAVPEGAGNLVLLLCAGGQPSAEDVIWFDDVSVCKLE